MNATERQFLKDIANVQEISIIPSLLEVICNSTGMGYAVIARVTGDRWIACAVRDEINFGLPPGGELQVTSTLCNEVNLSQKAIVIENVSEDPEYANHHTPKTYGLQSYISIPIFLKTGEFFGTLCAIDPNPAPIKNKKTIDMFHLFADLISFHLYTIRQIEQSKEVVEGLSKKLIDSIDENRQYQYISNHNLQEPLRKIRVFSSMLVDRTAGKDKGIEELARKLDLNAQKFSMLISDLSDYSGLNHTKSFNKVDLNEIVANVCTQLFGQLKEKDGVVNTKFMPTVHAIPLQMEQLFYHLILNAVKFSRPGVAPLIEIGAVEPVAAEWPEIITEENKDLFVQIFVKDNGVGIDEKQLKVIFDIFSKLSNDNMLNGEGIGLAYCRKIIQNHKGMIRAASDTEVGTTITFILPTGKID